jgi:hypothetical protein
VQQKEKAVESKKLPLNAMPWEGREPLAWVTGFRQASGVVSISLGYAVYPEAVLLFSTINLPNTPPQLWHQYWTSYVEAERMAESLAGEAEEYLRRFSLPMRPTEDLDYDDFIQHLHTRINNVFH